MESRGMMDSLNQQMNQLQQRKNNYEEELKAKKGKTSDLKAIIERLEAQKTSMIGANKERASLQAKANKAKESIDNYLSKREEQLLNIIKVKEESEALPDNIDIVSSL
jgi:chromosome segregation ATPase